VVPMAAQSVDRKSLSSKAPYGNGTVGDLVEYQPEFAVATRVAYGSIGQWPTRTSETCIFTAACSRYTNFH
jgi:hypothetical protein